MNAENDYNDIGALRPRSNDKEQTQLDHAAFFNNCVLNRVYEEIANAGISTTNDHLSFPSPE